VDEWKDFLWKPQLEKGKVYFTDSISTGILLIKFTYCTNNVIHCEGKVTEEKSFVSMLKFPTGVLTQEMYGE
jgi:hypothetical protein